MDPQLSLRQSVNLVEQRFTCALFTSAQHYPVRRWHARSMHAMELDHAQISDFSRGGQRVLQKHGLVKHISDVQSQL